MSPFGPLYPIDITAEEEAAGFTLQEIRRPQAFGPDRGTIQAVILDLAESFRLIKVADQQRGTWYNLEMFSTVKGFPPSDSDISKPKWYPIQSYYNMPSPFPAFIDAVMVETAGIGDAYKLYIRQRPAVAAGQAN